MTCVNFTVDDNIALEGGEAFAIGRVSWGGGGGGIPPLKRFAPLP